MLAYLAVTGERQRRESVAALLWPESSQGSAHKALRRDLSELNQALHGAWLATSRESIALHPGYQLDVAQFRQHLATSTARSVPPVDVPAVDAIAAAVDLYRGDFLSGFSLPDAPAFDEWQFFQSEHLRQSLASSLQRMIRSLSEEDGYEHAIPYAQRWVALDSLHEPAHYQLMVVLANAGQVGAALRQYDLCRQILAEELGVTPAAETTALYEELRSGTLISIPSASSVPRKARHNLPTQTTTFIGREAELADIKRLLVDEPGCRLLNLFGPGGIGKTRLALAAATEALDAFADGVTFVSLAPLPDAAFIVQAIAEGLRLTFYGQRDPKEQLLSYLSQKQLLLVVDNFEHLLDGADLLSDIARQAPAVVMLTTSRERLHLREEWVYEVPGLPFPSAGDESAESSDSYAAVQLFLQRARQSEAGFSPSRSEMAAIGRICQLVEGMPLGVELAAPWIRTLSCREIAAEIERNLDFLTTTLRNAPERHRSLRVVFEQTWERLAPAERAVLMRLSIFRGGCTRTAAEAVADAALPVLSSLIDRGLLRRTNLGRYELHELTRQFAAAKLATESLVVAHIERRHRAFFITFLETRTAAVKGHKQIETLAEIEADIGNVRVAWRRTVADQDSVAIERSALCLFIYYLYRNGYDEGLLEFQRALTAFVPVPSDESDEAWLAALVGTDSQHHLIGFLLAGLGYFLAHRRDLQKGQVLLEQALLLLRKNASGDRWAEAFTLLWLGWALLFRGRLAEGKRCAGESLALFAAAAEHWGEGWALLLLGHCLRYGRPAEAETVYQRGLARCYESGDQIVLSYLSLNMGTAASDLGHYARARPYIDRAIKISQSLSNILGLGYALFAQGRWEIAQGTYQQAIRTLQRCLTYLNQVGTVHAARAQMFLGLAHHRLGQHDFAAQLYVQAAEGLQAANSTLEFVHCLNYRGCLAYDQGMLHQAEDYQREALALLQDTEQEPAMAAATLLYLGQALIGLGERRYAEARETFRQALELAVAHKLAPIALEICVGVAELLIYTTEVDGAGEILALAAQHEAATFDTRQKARRLRALTNQPARLGTQTTHDHKQGQDLWAAMPALLPRLTATR